jgi:hypothetical protein
MRIKLAANIGIIERRRPAFSAGVTIGLKSPTIRLCYFGNIRSLSAEVMKVSYGPVVTDAAPHTFLHKGWNPDLRCAFHSGLQWRTKQTFAALSMAALKRMTRCRLIESTCLALLALIPAIVSCSRLLVLDRRAPMVPVLGCAHCAAPQHHRTSGGPLTGYG